MNHKARVVTLLNELRKKYDIKDEFNVRIIQKEHKRRPKPFMEIDYAGKVPTIYIFVNNSWYRFEKQSNNFIKRSLAHEIVHFLCYKSLKETNPKNLIKTLKLIDSIIDLKKYNLPYKKKKNCPTIHSP